MAIVVDPDNLDRHQVIFGTENQLISLYDVGDPVYVDGYDVTDGYAVAGTLTFESGLSTFQTDGVAADDILCILNTVDAGHYIIASVDSETQLTVSTDGYFVSFTGSDGYCIFDIREPTGGSIADGVTEQAIYSFSKEEWKTDTRSTVLGDDLIRHPIPLESITREQMEIGGGETHEDWNWFNDYTVKKIRTGGWAAKNTAGTTLEEWAGIITLGDLDTDTQVYYQTTSATTNPNDFSFTGAVNEAIQTYDNTGGIDYRSYLKLFARKKGKTYATSEISDIGVTTIETMVNRFPLAHSTDAAIDDTDAEILGTTPYRNTASVASGADGAKTINGVTFTSATNFAAAGVAIGDTLRITSGNEQGYYTISNVVTTTLTIGTDYEFSDWSYTENSLAWTVYSTNLLTGSTDGQLDNVDTNTGTLSSVTGGFTAAAIAEDDLVIITEAGSNYRGVYKVISNDSDNQLTINTVDRPILAQQTNVNFYVVNPGMYLQYKADSVVSGPATGNLTFTNANPDTIGRASGSWVGDGVTAGDIITISGSTSNDGSYTIATVAALTLTLVATDTLTNETVTGGLGSGVTVISPFKRDINSVTYGFRWRLLGNDATLSYAYQFVQHQLRQSTDIDWGPGTARGDVTNALLTYASPTGTTLDMYIDDLSATDLNNVTWTDATGETRTEPYVAAGTISFNVNLQNDADAEYTMFFTNDNAGDDTGRDFGTPEAIIVQDASSVDISGNVSGATSVSFTYDYDGNVQRGAASAGVDAPVTIVAIGLETAQYVLLTGTITRSKSNNFSLVASLERNYNNP